MHTNAWSITTPSDNTLAGYGDDEIIKVKVDLEERISPDHYFDGELDPLEADCEGYHRKVTLPVLLGDPTAPSGSGIVYTKTVSGTPELFFVEAVNNSPVQISKQGKINFDEIPYGYFNGELYQSTGYDYNLTASMISADWTKTITVNKRILLLIEFSLMANRDSANQSSGKTGGIKIIDSTNTDVLTATFPSIAWPTMHTYSADYWGEGETMRFHRRYITYLTPGTHTLRYIYATVLNNTSYYMLTDIRVRIKALFAFDDTITDAYTVS